MHQGKNYQTGTFGNIFYSHPDIIEGLQITLPVDLGVGGIKLGECRPDDPFSGLSGGVGKNVDIFCTFHARKPFLL
jgi:hypothetical protein